MGSHAKVKTVILKIRIHLNQISMKTLTSKNKKNWNLMKELNLIKKQQQKTGL